MKKPKLEEVFYTLPKYKQKELVKKLRFGNKRKKKLNMKQKEKYYGF